MKRKPGQGLARDVRRFLAAHIESVEQLEVLLLVRSDPSRGWTAAEIATTLRTADTSARMRLDDLARRGLVITESPDARFRLAPATPETAELLEHVAEAYRDRRVTVIEFIYARPPDAIRDLARAFRVGGDDDDDAG